ncbi:MAG: stage II sporulation protein R [Oscillospiraceae bacterium]|nr:stage II sporulation protein R [Oscillospiraceae bacterium]
MKNTLTRAFHALHHIVRTHALTLSLLFGIAVTFAVAGFHSFAEESHTLSQQVLRLHIMAESNSEPDQAFKLKLRDFILQRYALEFADADSLAAALETSVALLPEMQESANEFARENGVETAITAEITEMYFTTRTYTTDEGTFTYPAGTYTALRIVIGEGAGDNWWCVMFPMLCVPAVSERENVTAVTVPKSSETKPKVKFAVYEWLTKK